jgi:ABC-type dipeptide/oligopeptide/nickel transport system permease subunit
LEARDFPESAEFAGAPGAVGASAEITQIDPTKIAARSPWQLFWRRFHEDKLAMASLVFLVLLVIVAIAAPLVVKIAGAPGPNVEDQNALNPIFATATGPSSQHIFGVDGLGRDVFSRVVYGARVSLVVAFVATFWATLLGVIAGLVAGYFRGWTDTIISRAVDVLLAIPYLMLAIGLAAACTFSTSKSGTSAGCFGGHIDVQNPVLVIVGAVLLVAAVAYALTRSVETVSVSVGLSGLILLILGLVSIPLPAIKPGIGVVIFVIAVTSWTYIARIVRGQTLSLREKEFIESARASGAGHARIIFRELLPNLTAPIIVYASILIPQVILYEAALSYLGVGVVDQPSWGQMISDATGDFSTYWWYMLFPGLALLFTVLAFNLVGDAMQDALNPRAKRT